MRHDGAGAPLGQMVRLILVPGLLIRLAFPTSDEYSINTKAGNVLS